MPDLPEAKAPSLKKSIGALSAFQVFEPSSSGALKGDPLSLRSGSGQLPATTISELLFLRKG